MRRDPNDLDRYTASERVTRAWARQHHRAWYRWMKEHKASEQKLPSTGIDDSHYLTPRRSIELSLKHYI